MKLILGVSILLFVRGATADADGCVSDEEKAVRIAGSYYKVCPQDDTSSGGGCGDPSSVASRRGRRLITTKAFIGREILRALIRHVAPYVLEYVGDVVLGQGCSSLSDLEEEQATQLDFCREFIQHPMVSGAQLQARDRAAKAHYEFFEDLELIGSDSKPVRFLSVMNSSSLCRQIVAHAVCLGELPPCDCEYQTACVQMCTNLNECGKVASGSNVKLCNDCKALCEVDCDGGDDNDDGRPEGVERTLMVAVLVLAILGLTALLGMLWCKKAGMISN
jgi:hypothetical protein